MPVAIESILRPVARLLNDNIAESTAAQELCAELDGTSIAVRVRDSALAAYFLVRDDGLDIVADSDCEPDVIISGSLLTLARMPGETGVAAIRDGRLDLTGDAETAQRFQRLLELARPELEEELSGVVGDVAAHRLGEFARGLARWGHNARQTMGANVREYLQEESRDVPSRYEVERFGRSLSRLRDDVARLEARLDRLSDRD